MTTFASSSELVKKLHGLLIRQRLVLFFAGVVVTLAVLGGCAVLLGLVANVMVVPVWLKLALMIISGTATVYFFARFALARLFAGGIDSVALQQEQRHPDLKGRLIAAIEFARTQPQKGFSQDLIKVNEQQAMEKAGLIDLNEVVSFHAVFRSARYLVVAAVAAALMLAVFPGFFSHSYEVYSSPTTEVAPPLAYSLKASPGSTEWVKYRDLTIGGILTGLRVPDEAAIHYRLAGGSWQKETVDLRNVRAVPSESGDSLAFATTIRQVSKSLDYFVEAGRLTSAIHRIDVVDRPRVTDIGLAIFYPSYTGMEPTTLQENNGSFSALVGSRANIEIETNLPVTNAGLLFDDSSRVALEVDGRTAATTLSIRESRTYHIRLTDHLGEHNPDPIEYYITAIPDEYPTVEVLQPGFNVNLNDDMRLPLKVRIQDDFGFSSLVLKYIVVSQGRAGDESVAVLHFSDRIKTEGEISFNWDLDRLSIYPGDYVSYHFEVADNDAISGPKLGKSRTYVARLPSLEEIVAETEIETDSRITDSEELLRQGKELAERMKSATRRLQAEARRQGEKENWQQQKELEQILQKHEEMLGKIDELAERMDESLEKMQENALMSREIMEKLEQIQKLFEEVATPEMRQAQQRLLEAMKNMDREEMLQAMKDFEMSQKELLERLERQISLLKRMQLAQKMESMLRQAEQILEEQDAVNEEAEDTPEDKLPEMSDTESSLQKKMQDLKAESGELREMLQDEGTPPTPQAEQFADALEQTDADEDMGDMAEALEQKEKKDAVKQGKSAATKMAEMIDRMQKQLASMQGQENDEIRRVMRRAIEDATYLSGEQEQLLRHLEELSSASESIRDMAGDQQDLLNASRGLRNTISQLGKISPFVAIEMNAVIDEAAIAMSNSIEKLNEKRSRQAARDQRDAMSQLNRAAIRMMESLEQQQQCENASQCSNPMTQLEKLSQQQQQLNERTQNQCQNPGAGKQGQKQGQGEQLRQQMKRLAGEQGAIRKSMQELSRELAGDRQILGRLDDLSREMKEVEEDLSQGEAGQETFERQLRIYSRMLEATRSLQRRDLTEQRQARTAEDNLVRVPAALPPELMNDRSNFEERLKRYMGDDYPAQYEEQIKAYFRALMEATTAPNQPEQPEQPEQ